MHRDNFPVHSNQIRQKISPIGSIMFVKISFKTMNIVKNRLNKDLLRKLF
jgi:hypothetical protein